ncbi:MAG: PTS sugar transporter subunit IIA, partial [Spirochaetales bacterium]|nr:PTS sugar transporter subunit IIA [Spirochaetales bacterium]
MEYNTEILTLSETAVYLKLSEKTVLKMARNGEIPCAKVANQWRFVKTVLDDWLISRMQVIPQNDMSRLIESEYDIVPINRLIDESLILTDLKPAPKREILKSLVDLAREHKLIADEEDLLEKLLERESIVSTAVGKGIALPHLRKPSSKLVHGPRIVIGMSRTGLDFESLDGKKTYLVFLILTDSETV